MQKATSEDFKKFPKFQKQKFGDLKLSLLRNGHVDSKDSWLPRLAKKDIRAAANHEESYLAQSG